MPYLQGKLKYILYCSALWITARLSKRSFKEEPTFITSLKITHMRMQICEIHHNRWQLTKVDFLLFTCFSFTLTHGHMWKQLSVLSPIRAAHKPTASLHYVLYSCPLHRKEEFMSSRDLTEMLWRSNTSSQKIVRHFLFCLVEKAIWPFATTVCCRTDIVLTALVSIPVEGSVTENKSEWIKVLKPQLMGSSCFLWQDTAADNLYFLLSENEIKTAKLTLIWWY